MIIGLAGKARAGKDTVANILVAEHGYTRVAFADALKDIAYQLNPLVPYGDTAERLVDLVDTQGWDEAKSLYDVRAFLQNLGVAVRQYDADFWVKAALRIHSGDENIVISDVRFPNELDAVLDAGGAVYRVVREGSGLTGTAASHPSETLLDDYDIPVIDNNGSIEDLAKGVASCLTSWA